MIDSGATALFLDHSFVREHNIPLTPLRQPIDLYNIDGSSNQAGRITHFARLKLTLDGFDEWTDFLATNLGGENVILGLPWLCVSNCLHLLQTFEKKRELPTRLSEIERLFIFHLFFYI